jgi:hypothetical protein
MTTTMSLMEANNRGFTREPLYRVHLPEALIGDNWVMVDGTAYDLLHLVRFHGWSALELVKQTLQAQRNRLEYHVDECDDDRGFYMDSEGGPNWILAAIHIQLEQVQQSERVLEAWLEQVWISRDGQPILKPEHLKTAREIWPDGMQASTAPYVARTPRRRRKTQ